MEPIVLLIVVIAVVLLDLLWRLLGVVRDLLRDHVYERRLPFLSPVQRRCLSALEQAGGESCRVFAQVALTALMVAASSGTQRRRALNKIQGQRFDFVICGRVDGLPLGVVELLPAGALKRRTRRRLAWLKSLCDQLALPLVTLPEQPHYDLNTLRTALDAILRQQPLPRDGEAIDVNEEDLLLQRLSASLREPKN